MSKSDIERIKDSQAFADSVQQLAFGQSFDTAMDKFLNFALFYFCSNPTQEQKNEFNEALHGCDADKYLHALRLFGKASDDYNDALGDCMMFKMSRNSNQVFTPKHIAELMAELAPENENDYEVMHDSCCGSGRLVLGALKKSRQDGKSFYAYASDIDDRCVRMTLLNLCINCACGTVKKANAITGEVFAQYKITPDFFGLVKYEKLEQ